MIGTPSQIITRLLPLVKEDSDKQYELKEYREKRGLQANAYFHRLVGLLAHGSGSRFYEVKNELIAQYGNHEFIRGSDGRPVYEILPDDDEWKKSITEHYVPTEYVDDFRGVKMRAFLKFAGTHTYSSKEMAELITGTRNECVGSGIPWEEIETPEEKRLFYGLQNKAKQGDGHSAESQA